MKQVNVKVADLLIRLEENRMNHRAIFKSALAGYRKEVIKQLDVALKDATEGRKIQTAFYLSKPVDQTKDYDQAILMLKMHTEDEITVTSTEFSNYVMDDWSWKDDFILTNSAYTAIADK